MRFAGQNGAKRITGSSSVLLTGAVALLALPSAVLAFSSRFDALQAQDKAEEAQSGFVPAMVDPRLARSITVRALSKGRLFRFTPAATTSRMDRSLTVAVRLDANSTRTISTTVPVSCAKAATASWAWLAVCSVRCDRSWLPLAISALARAML
ncbi:MAG TPA: hypothetical protein PKG84_10600, partial [Novosphingobium sp.]|nr:hypothetical protein [Novosphingobium sp.]